MRVLGGTWFLGRRVVERLHERAGTITDFAPDAVVDTWALTGTDVDVVLPVLPEADEAALAAAR